MKTSLKFLQGMLILSVFHGCSKEPDNPFDSDIDSSNGHRTVLMLINSIIQYNQQGIKK